jgi:hypothetical protein
MMTCKHFIPCMTKADAWQMAGRTRMRRSSKRGMLRASCSGILVLQHKNKSRRMCRRIIPPHTTPSQNMLRQKSLDPVYFLASNSTINLLRFAS